MIFVGRDEYCNSDFNDQRDNIFIRCTHEAFKGRRADKDEALAALAAVVKTNVPVWDRMAAILAALNSSLVEEERAQLGSRKEARSDALLTSWITDLNPLPWPQNATFKSTYIADWFKEDFDTEAAYRRFPGRKDRLRVVLAKTPPSYLFFYGADAANWFRASYPTVSLRRRGNVEAGRLKDTTIALTGFYGGQDAETRFTANDIDDLIAVVRDADSQ